MEMDERRGRPCLSYQSLVSVVGKSSLRKSSERDLGKSVGFLKERGGWKSVGSRPCVFSGARARLSRSSNPSRCLVDSQLGQNQKLD